MSKLKMITISVPEGSYIVPLGSELEWAKRIIKKYKKNESKKKAK